MSKIEKSGEPNMIFQGAHIKIYKPVKPIVKRGRPQTAVSKNMSNKLA